MRILIVGAGIAGLTLAALLKQRGIEPMIVEKSSQIEDVGYMLGIYPIGSNVLHGLGCFEKFMDVSEPCESYIAYSNNKRLKACALKAITENYGPYQNLTRYELIKILVEACGSLPIHFNTEVKLLEQNNKEVSVTFSNDKQQSFDLVVGADGIHSHIRSLILTKPQYPFFHTGWGCWVWWADEKTSPKGIIEEFWGTGTFCGLYPVKGKVGVVAGGNFSAGDLALLHPHFSRHDFIEKQFASLKRSRPEIFAALPADTEKVFFWSLEDQRARTWHQGRVVLLGDSATAFLPTAGIGASMAMGSAAVLNDELSRVDAKWIPRALHLFEKRRKASVESAQSNSRQLAKLMFANSAFKAALRNCLTKMLSTKALIKSIVKDFDKPI